MATVDWNRMDSEVKSDMMALIFSKDQRTDSMTVVELTAKDIRYLMDLLFKSRLAMAKLWLREKIIPFSSK